MSRCIIGILSKRGVLELQVFNAEYVGKLVARDAETERHFATYFGPLLAAKLRGRLRSREAAEDARQDTLMRVINKIRQQGGLDNPERLGAYVRAICNNVLMEKYREQQRYGQGDEALPEQADWRPDPESEFVTSQRKKLVHAVLEELNPKDRELLRAAFIEEREKEQICREMGVDGDYLRVLLHRARGRFKSMLLKRHSAAV